MLFKVKCDILDVYVRFIDSGGFSFWKNVEKCGKNGHFFRAATAAV